MPAASDDGDGDGDGSTVTGPAVIRGAIDDGDDGTGAAPGDDKANGEQAAAASITATSVTSGFEAAPADRLGLRMAA